MKVVSCKNCGAKYQLEDYEDISTYECSSCSGELEYLEEESSPMENTEYEIESVDKYSNFIIVKCEDCGLKYKIGYDENILDYECESCGGFLRYLDDNLNKELDEYLKERPIQIIPTPDFEEEEEIEENTQNNNRNYLLNSIKDFPDRFDSLFSDELMQEMEYEEYEDYSEFEKPTKTARTTIPKSVLNKFEREFNIPKSNDYYVLKAFLKEEFLKSMGEYYDFDYTESMTTNKNHKNISESGNKEKTEKKSFMEKIRSITTNDIILIIGIILFIGGIIEVFAINSGIGIGILLIGVILLCIGLIRSKDEEKTEKRSRIIREHLLSLSDEYYVFYNVRIPNSSSGINHVVVGPTGIYGLISQKYNPQLKLESENENKNLISSEDAFKLEAYNIGSSSRFKYTTSNVQFEQDNKIKQKSLRLGENLINFLNDNNVKHCFVEPLVGFVNEQVVVINMPLTDEDLFIEELIIKIKTGTVKLDNDTIDKCAVLINQYSADCSAEIL